VQSKNFSSAEEKIFQCRGKNIAPKRDTFLKKGYLKSFE
jgi:hypothetical protein